MEKSGIKEKKINPEKTSYIHLLTWNFSVPSPKKLLYFSKKSSLHISRWNFTVSNLKNFLYLSQKKFFSHF